MTKPLILIINGVSGSGKDEFALALKHEFEVDNISSVDQIKKIASILGWDGTRDHKSRKFLADLKDLATEFNDAPLQYVYSQVKKSDAEICVLHIREVLEIIKAKELFASIGYNAQAILIERPEVLSKQIPQNTGDLGALQQFDYDVTIINDDSLEHLHQVSIKLANKLLTKTLV